MQIDWDLLIDKSIGQESTTAYTATTKSIAEEAESTYLPVIQKKEASGQKVSEA